MWFVWFMWGIVGVAIIATIILLTGKGSMLVTGFNTKNAEELTKYDVKKVSRQLKIQYNLEGKNIRLQVDVENLPLQFELLSLSGQIIQSQIMELK